MSSINLVGVKTHNLKSIDVSFPMNRITAIAGVSGGGKSSLAYSTLYEICRGEFNSIETGTYNSPSYDIERFENPIPAVAIKQTNSNINPRSTLYSYLNISALIASSLQSDEVNIEPDLLKVNKPQLQCPSCDGLGAQLSVSRRKVTNPNASIQENPFRPWQNNRNDKHHRLLVEFCKQTSIPLDVPFDNLTDQDKKKLLFGSSDIKLEVSFKVNGKRRKRDIQYIGVMDFINDQLSSESKSDYNMARQFSDEQTCSVCFGSRINNAIYKNSFISNLSFVEFLSLPIDEILKRGSFKNASLAKLLQILSDISISGIGYLSLSRSIPSLSGGELQKLNFTRLLNSQITGILVIIDEISSQVHPSDFHMLLSGLKNITAQNNTVVIVEHNDSFIKYSDNVIFIGPEAGSRGGFIVPPSNYTQEIHTRDGEVHNHFITIESVSSNNVKDVNFNFPLNAITALVGKSGSGKSSVAKYIRDNIEGVVYISQDSIRGNIKSTVATLTSLNRKLVSYFSSEFKVPESTFSLKEGAPLTCSKCHGLGVIKIQRSFESDVELDCDKCNGELYSPDADLYKIDGYSIKDLFKMTFEELSHASIQCISTTCQRAVSLGLGHLSLSRKSRSLSGGELRRIKILINLPVRKSSDKILIIDEPAAGLDDDTAMKVMKFIRSFCSSFRFVLVIDHKPSVFGLSDYVIEIGPGSGHEGGRVVFEGTPSEYYETRHLPYLSSLNSNSKE